MADGVKELEKELPHILVILILVVVLLVVLTKFQWIHCSQVPGNWCEIYCNTIMRSHSRIALISGDTGIGDPQTLAGMLTHARSYNSYIEPFPQSQMSFGLLKGYDLVIIEKMKNVSITQAQALESYLNAGGSMIWIGDSATRYYVDEFELQKARDLDTQMVAEMKARGETPVNEHYYYDILVNSTTQRGFGILEKVLMARYIETKTGQKNVELETVNIDHLTMKGLMKDFGVPVTEFAVVSENPEAVSKLAVLKVGDKEYPGIFETRYAGRVLYVSYPLEQTNSTVLLQNILDYLVTC